MRHLSIDQKAWLHIIVVFVLLTAVIFILEAFNIIDLGTIYAQKYDFHYNAISTSSVIGGFLFTGISILIAILDRQRIKRLYEFGYLNSLLYTSFIGIFFAMATIAIGLFLIVTKLNINVIYKFIGVEIYTEILCVVFFVWSVKYLIFVIRKLKE